MPYQDAKLTQILQPCLGGESRTVVVACASLEQCNAVESVHTLRFAEVDPLVFPVDVVCVEHESPIKWTVLTVTVVKSIAPPPGSLGQSQPA